MRHLALVFPVLLVLTACGPAEHADLKGWMTEQAKGMKGKVPELPRIEPFPAVSYEAETYLSPFSALKIVTKDAAADKSSPDQQRPRQPLENYPLEDLRLTGVIVDGAGPHALIQTPPPNKPKHVRVGEFMGQNFGKVTAITRDGITVVETVKDTSGAWVEREVPMFVPRDGGKK